MKKSAVKIDDYSHKQCDFLIAMLDCDGNISEAAKSAKISEATAHRWLNNGLNKDIKAIKNNFVESYLNKLQIASGYAVDSIIEILRDKNTSVNIKLKASKIALDMTLKIREDEEIVAKLNELEERVAAYEKS